MPLEGITLDRLLSTILNNVLNCFEYYRGVAYLWDKEKENLVCHGTGGLSEESEKIIRSKPLNVNRHDCIEIRAAQSSTYTYIEDPTNGPDLTKIDLKISHQHGGRGSLLFVPLRSKGETFGILGVERYPTQVESYPGQFEITEKNIRSLMLFVNHASIAIENARLYAQNARKIDYLVRLQEIYRELNVIMDMDQLTEDILDYALSLSQASSGAIWCCDAGARRAHLRLLRGYPSSQRTDIRLSLDQHPFIEVYHEQRLALIPELTKCAYSLPVSPLKGSTILIPITYEDQTAAILQLDHRDSSIFDETATEVLKIYASQVGKLIENVKLYKRLLSERRFIDNVMNSAGVGILITDAKGKILSINPRIEEIFVTKSSEVIGKPADVIFSGDQRAIFHIIRETMRKKKDTEKEVNFVQKEDELILKVNSFVVFDGDKRFSGVATLIQDVTETKRLSESLRRMEKMAAIGTMAAGVAHELRNPLSGIYTTIQTLTKELACTGEQKLEMDAVLEEVDRMETLIQEILRFSKPLPLTISKGDINAVLKKCVAALQDKIKAKRIRVLCEAQDETAYLRADMDKMHQVFLNLLVNAIEASEEGGTVEIHSRSIPFSNNGRPKGIEIQVTDHGVGIPPDNLSKIFDPFFTTKNYGTGLGLTICAKIIEEHNGEIIVKSENGRGSVFTIRLRK